MTSSQNRDLWFLPSIQFFFIIFSNCGNTDELAVYWVTPLPPQLKRRSLWMSPQIWLSLPLVLEVLIVLQICCGGDMWVEDFFVQLSGWSRIGHDLRLNPNWHEGGHFLLLVLFWIRFLSKISNLFWRWKLTSIQLIWHAAKVIESCKNCT